MPRTERIPYRSDLIAQLDATNRYAIPVVIFQVVLSAFLIYLIDWPSAIQQPILTTVAIGIFVGPFVLSILQYLVQKKKRIEDLREQTRFGVFDKHLLRKLYQDTLKRLALPDDRLPVYIVADKGSNAMVAHWGLGGLLKWTYGIYLHRQMLHKFNPDELQDVIGHELGHYYKHYVLLDRYRWVMLVFGALLGLYIVQCTDVNTTLGFIILPLCLSGLWWLSGLPLQRNILAIEYLCDDFGAHVHGVIVSINGLLKLGAESEVMTAVQRQAFLSKHSQKLEPQQIVDAIDAAIPYGHTSKEQLLEAVEKELKQKSSDGISVAGFLRFMWQSDTDAETKQEIENQMLKLRALDEVTRLPWERLLPNPTDIRFDEFSIGSLIELIENFPEGALFRDSEALGIMADTHPPLKDRILYLWYNRDKIERDAGIARPI